MRVGVDIGGTFTDIVLEDESFGIRIFKVLTTHDDPSEAVAAGVNVLMHDIETSLEDVDQIIHGTTLVTNAVVARRGAKTALLVTRGFRDILEIGTEDRFDMYDLMIENPDPVVPRSQVFEVTERVLADGEIAQSWNSEELRSICERLVSEGYESVAICFLHSYRNPVNEEAVRDFLVSRLQMIPVCTSFDVSPAIREFFRASTTTVNAYVIPIVDQYLQSLEERFHGMGLGADLWLMISNGDICTPEIARTYPVRLIESGPAAGALAAARNLMDCGHRDGLSFDMGGTTAKACLISEEAPGFANAIEVAREYRFKKGSGLPLQVRSVELIEIGAGGGSIASVDALGLIKIGPESAQSDPGPASYGRGGTHATVTDADLILGYLNPDHFLGGEIQLFRAAAEDAIIRDVAKPLGLEVIDAAAAVHQLVNENMASAARLHVIEQARDPATLPLMAFGGAGPVHACGVARILGSPQLIVPPDAGVNSAYGLLSARLGFDFIRSLRMQLDEVDWATVENIFREMEAEGTELLARAGLTRREIDISRFCDVRFVGQGTELEVALPVADVSVRTRDEIRSSFLRKYRSLYKHSPESISLEVLSWGVVTSGPKPTASLVRKRQETARHPVKGERSVYWGRKDGFLSTVVLDRYALRPGDTYQGPLIIEERESTTVLDPETHLTVDEKLNLVAEFS